MIIDHIRDINEFRNLYDNRPMPCQYDFDFLVKNPHLYCFYDEDEGFLKGFITIQKEDDVLTLSGIALPKQMADVVTAIITVCKAFNEDIYSITPLKHAGLVLRKAGFKKISDKKYVRYKNG